MHARYGKYLGDFATNSSPLNWLTVKDTEWNWVEDAQKAFQKIKEGVVTTPVLAYLVPKLPYILDTDASDMSVGAKV